VSALSGIVRGKQSVPFKVVIYSAEGLGKSTLAAGSPSPVFIDVEGGTSHLDVARFPAPTGLSDVLACLDTLATDKHEFKTVVVDTLDALEPMVWAHVIASDNPKYAAKTIEEVGGGYGKGFLAALDVWRIFYAKLERLRSAGMNVVLLAHSVVKPFKSPDPTIDSFDRYELKLNGKAAALAKEYPDALLFGQFEIANVEKEGRTKGIATGKRILHTTHSAAWDAKNRFGLPPTIPLSWEALDRAASSSIATTTETVTQEITELLKSKSAKTVKSSLGGMERAGSDLAKLTTLRDWIKGQN
jgi:hypothetical protein